MFKEATSFTVIPLGYENIIPELSQYQHRVKDQTALNNLRKVPDFALISGNKEAVFLVEVKYRENPTNENDYEIAKEICQKWDDVCLFIPRTILFILINVRKLLKRRVV
jgi:hypothetical protein